MNINQTVYSDSTIPAPIRTGAITTLLATAALRATQMIQVWRERALQRHVLATLDDHMLDDIGVDRATAHAEAEKPFWRV